MKTRPSATPIALLLTTGLLCLAISMVVPTTTVSYTGPAYWGDGQLAQPASTVTTTDPLAAAIVISLLVLGVAALAGGGWQTIRRRRWTATLVD